MNFIQITQRIDPELNGLSALRFINIIQHLDHRISELKIYYLGFLTQIAISNVLTLYCSTFLNYQIKFLKLFHRNGKELRNTSILLSVSSFSYICHSADHQSLSKHKDTKFSYTISASSLEQVGRYDKFGL